MLLLKNLKEVVNKQIRLFVLFSLLFALPGSFGFAQIKHPKLPKFPKIPFVQKKNQNVKKKIYRTLKAEIFFYKNLSSFKGLLKIEPFSLKIISNKNGFKFYKMISLANIKSIDVLKWKGYSYNPYKRGYVFYPIEYRIIDQKGIEYIYSKNIKALNKVIFKNDYGLAYFYSIYYDYKQGNAWEMTKRKGSSLVTELALNKVICRVVFDKQEAKGKSIKKESAKKLISKEKKKKKK